jgi:hypothetical protein
MYTEFTLNDFANSFATPNRASISKAPCRLSKQFFPILFLIHQITVSILIQGSLIE